MSTSTRPAVGAPAAWAFPTPETHRLPNGLTLKAFHLPGQYVISVRTVIPLSTTAERRDREGIAALMARLLDEGTTNHSSEEFAELMERKGIALGAGMSDGGLGVDLDVPSRNLADALEILRQVLAEPAFPEDEVRRMIRSRLAEIEQERALAPHRAMREFIATHFDPAERASRPSAGRPETVSAITREDLVDFHARHVGPEGATVVVAGDLTDVDLPALATATLGEWRPPLHVVPQLPTTPPRTAKDAARIVLVDRPGSVQSELCIGWDGPDRRNPGWAAYPVLGYIVGGSPTARIDDVLREEKGYTYGIRSSFRPRRAGGLFVTSGSVRSDATVESLGLLLDILQQARDGFSEEELRAGVDFITRTAPGRFATADAVADEAAARALDDLPDTFTTDNLARMRALTPEDLSRAFSEVVTGAWTVVIVGDAGAHAEAVRALDRGPVSVIGA
ncbi:M16 family metallopeptidase [Actinomycetota bacterium]